MPRGKIGAPVIQTSSSNQNSIETQVAIVKKLESFTLAFYNNDLFEEYLEHVWAKAPEFVSHDDYEIISNAIAENEDDIESSTLVNLSKAPIVTFVEDYEPLVTGKQSQRARCVVFGLPQFDGVDAFGETGRGKVAKCVAPRNCMFDFGRGQRITTQVAAKYKKECEKRGIRYESRTRAELDALVEERRAAVKQTPTYIANQKIISDAVSKVFGYMKKELGLRAVDREPTTPEEFRNFFKGYWDEQKTLSIGMRTFLVDRQRVGVKPKTYYYDPDTLMETIYSECLMDYETVKLTLNDRSSDTELWINIDSDERQEEDLCEEDE
jgi:hypothetical protein